MAENQWILTQTQARRFMLYKQGLLGKRRFKGASGVMDFIRQAGCIQFDPIDVCGKNPELVLQSRVSGFEKPLLYDLLYNKRTLIDYFDKNLSIVPLEDWPAFESMRRRFAEKVRSQEAIENVEAHILERIEAEGPKSSKDFEIDAVVDWYWSDTKLSRAALEALYFRGDLLVHHKKGSFKYYDLSRRHIPEALLSAGTPFETEQVRIDWHVYRRIGAVGLLWNKGSDAFLGIDGMKTAERNAAFERLFADKKIDKMEVEGLDVPLYFQTDDVELLRWVLTDPRAHFRCELLAPLDNFLWDRKLISALFGFDYKWEIYTPEVQRKYGYYVLPILYGDRLVGRTEAVRRRDGVLEVKNLWLEPDVKRTESLEKVLTEMFTRFAVFNGCTEVKGWIE
ncbi:MAG: uncharacterized protein PWQ12_302 [Clostridiales bacterium]|jgi:hypothetical protein|nr:uncharacterized protein [Clostridiales bacterium]